MKRNRYIVLVLLVLGLVLSSCGTESPISFSSPSSPQPESEDWYDPMEAYISRRCMAITSLYRSIYLEAEKEGAEDRWSNPKLKQESIDLIEATLVEEGFPVLDSNENYPSYLVSAEQLWEFWRLVQEEESASQEIISVSDEGVLIYRLFTYDSDADSAWFYSMSGDPGSGEAMNYERQRILDWAFTEKGNFYFRTRPAGDKHYEDYILIRTTPPDTKLWDMNMRYIMPVGYIATNIFLTDWSENAWNELCFNDLWEYFYYAAYERQYIPESADYIPAEHQYQIPAEEFERIVQPYFRVDTEVFRQLAHYQAEADCYLWRPIETNDFVTIWYYTCIPEVTDYRINEDGTVSIMVEVMSTDLKLDCLFAHEVTVRPLESGGFQYVSNQVTYQTSYGLPFCEPRINWQ